MLHHQAASCIALESIFNYYIVLLLYYKKLRSVAICIFLKHKEYKVEVKHVVETTTRLLPRAAEQNK